MVSDSNKFRKIRLKENDLQVVCKLLRTNTFYDALFSEKEVMVECLRIVKSINSSLDNAQNLYQIGVKCGSKISRNSN